MINKNVNLNANPFIHSKLLNTYYVPDMETWKQRGEQKKMAPVIKEIVHSFSNGRNKD